ncbi:hypothetical protein D9619_008345 [Psilocybe cf. subviscida]|uniref:Uncharacterized protein n=1 Tax=Psilocybe cf. subviscida TaxID=2480587 RepID=A0A8H5B9S6_9AGAR|nr:hypothetical protein D9619_008345 [Psilocybe cf. subviscida]
MHDNLFVVQPRNTSLSCPLPTATMVLTLRQAGLISTTVQGILYGAAVIMFVLTIWILLQKGRHQRVNWKMIVAACALLLFATAEMIVNIIRISEGFVSVGPSLPGGPEQYFQDVAETTFVVKSVLYNVQTLILDGVVIYRTYVVWQSIYPVLVPIFGWFGLLATVVGLNIALVQARLSNGHESDIFFVNTGRWITAYYSATLAANLSASCLLAYRIWYLDRKAASIRLQGQLKPVIRAIIESGLIYSMTVTSALIAFVVKSPGVYVILDMVSPIILITFCLIIVRIGMANHSNLITGTSASLSVSVSSAAGGKACNCHHATLNTGRNHADVYSMKPLAVEVTQFQEIEADSDSGMGGLHSRTMLHTKEKQDSRAEEMSVGSGN